MVGKGWTPAGTCPPTPGQSRREDRASSGSGTCPAAADGLGQPSGHAAEISWPVPLPPHGPPSRALPPSGAACPRTGRMDVQHTPRKLTDDSGAAEIYATPRHVCRIRTQLNKECNAPPCKRVHEGRCREVSKSVKGGCGKLVTDVAPLPAPFPPPPTHVLCNMALQLLPSKDRLEGASP